MGYSNVTSLCFSTRLAFNAAADGGVFLGTISIKFCMKVKGWLRYIMAKKYAESFVNVVMFGY